MRSTALVFLLAAALATAACNTVSGVGRDLQAAGRAVTSSSSR